METTINPNIFRAYDIRGLYNQDLSSEIMYKIGLGIGTYVKQILNYTEVTLGNDIRYSSIPLAHSFIAGVISTGVDILYVGTTAFGQTLFQGWKEGEGAIAFITASHLPPEWNGIKFYHNDGVGFSEEELMKVRDIVIDSEFDIANWDKVGKVRISDPKPAYIEFFKGRIKGTKDIRIALDCGGGSSTLSAPELFTTLGFDVVPIFCEPDPLFTSRPSDPKPKNLTVLVQKVLEHNCNFGVAFDGDGDRSVIVDDKGKILSADETGIILAKYGLKEKKGVIVANVECSKAVKEQLEPIGFTVKQIPVGHTFLTIEAKKEKSPLGIESSGHLILPEFFLFDDALVIPLKMTEILSSIDRPLSSLVAEIPSYLSHKEEINCSDNIKFEVIEALKQKLRKKYSDVNTMDGIRIDTDEGWVLIRPSNTSPIIRLTIEAKTDEALENFKVLFTDLVEKQIQEM